MTTDKRKTSSRILGVSEWPTEGELKKAYRALSKQFHPDLNKETVVGNRFMQITEAYDFLLENLGEKPSGEDADRFVDAETVTIKRTPKAEPKPEPPPAPNAPPPPPKSGTQSPPAAKAQGTPRFLWLISVAVLIFTFAGIRMIWHSSKAAETDMFVPDRIIPSVASPLSEARTGAPSPVPAPVPASAEIPGFTRRMAWVKVAVLQLPKDEKICGRTNGAYLSDPCSHKGDTCQPLSESGKSHNGEFIVLMCWEPFYWKAVEAIKLQKIEVCDRSEGLPHTRAEAGSECFVKDRLCKETKPGESVYHAYKCD